jgi:glucokinase
VTLAAGIDVGGTKCLGVVVDEHGVIVRQGRRPTPHGQTAILHVLANLARELAPYDSLGIGVPGLVTRTGTLRAAPNLVNVSELAVGPRLSERLGHPVAVDNDATCAAAAEWRHGAGRGATDMVMVTLGTGIGGGIISGNQVQRGANGFAGEIGHIVVHPDGPPCPCGRRGCWERYASGSGLGRLAQEAAAAGGLAAVLDTVGDVGAIRGEDLQLAARDGDTEALEVIDDYGRWVALGLVNLTNILDPSIFVLGGGLAASADLYLGPIQKWFRRLLYSPDLRPHPALVFAQLGSEAGAIGASLLPQLQT